MAEGIEHAILNVNHSLNETYSIELVASASVSIIDDDRLINFQPASSQVPAGYLVDSGAIFGPRGNGLSYGWNSNISSRVFERNVNADRSLDTLAVMRTGDTWEIDIPNGFYEVFFWYGDPSNSVAPSGASVTIEGQSIGLYSQLAANEFSWTGTSGISINDGRLTMTKMGAAVDLPINRVTINMAQESNRGGD